MGLRLGMRLSAIPSCALTFLFGIIPWRGSVGTGTEYHDKGYPFATWLTVPPQIDYELMHVVCYFALGVFLLVGSCDLSGADYFNRYVIWGNFLPHGIVILITSLIGGTIDAPISRVTEETTATTVSPPWPTNLME